MSFEEITVDKKKKNDNAIPLSAQAQVDDGERKPSNPKDVAARTERRVDFSLIPLEGLVHEATAFAEGDAKYGGHNYVISQVGANTYIAAALRHIYKYLYGEDVDPVTNVHHLGSARACLNVILSAAQNGFLVDDRPPAVRGLPSLFGGASTTIMGLYDMFPEKKHRWTQKNVKTLVKQWYAMQEQKKKDLSPVATEESMDEKFKAVKSKRGRKK